MIYQSALDHDLLTIASPYLRALASTYKLDLLSQYHKIPRTYHFSNRYEYLLYNYFYKKPNEEKKKILKIYREDKEKINCFYQRVNQRLVKLEEAGGRVDTIAIPEFFKQSTAASSKETYKFPTTLTPFTPQVGLKDFETYFQQYLKISNSTRALDPSTTVTTKKLSGESAEENTKLSAPDIKSLRSEGDKINPVNLKFIGLPAKLTLENERPQYGLLLYKIKNEVCYHRYFHRLSSSQDLFNIFVSEEKKQKLLKEDLEKDTSLCEPLKNSKAYPNLQRYRIIENERFLELEDQLGKSTLRVYSTKI